MSDNTKLSHIDSSNGLLGILSSLSGGPLSLAECARSTLESYARGVSVAVGIVGRPLMDIVRNHRRDEAEDLVSRHIAEHTQRAFSRDEMAYSKGREWLVSRPGSPVLENMNDADFTAYRNDIALSGGTLVTLVYKGSSIRDMSAVMTRYVGGMVDGATLDIPAMVSATAHGVQHAFFKAGQRLVEAEDLNQNQVLNTNKSP